MPISSPSYFPSVRGTDQIVGLNAGTNQTGARVFLAGAAAGANSTLPDSVIVGNAAADAGITDLTYIPNATVIGSQAATALLNGGSLGQIVGGIVILGKSALAAQVYASACVVIGASAAAALTTDTAAPFNRNVVVGPEAIGAMTATGGRVVNESVVMGYRAYYGSANPTAQGVDNCVIIGSQALGSYDLNGSGNSNLVSVVCIGHQAMQNVAAVSTQTATVIGATACQNFCGDSVTVVGYAAQGGLSSTVLGASSSGGVRTVIVGSNNAIGNGGDRNVLIGVGADTGETASIDDRLIIGTNDGGGGGGPMVYGYFATGNLLLTGWAQASRAQVAAVAGTNQLWLPNGTVGAGSPVGGGFLYVSGGALHWKGSGGTDTVIAPA